MAVQNNQSECIDYLLAQVSCFMHAEEHDWEYGAQYVYPFVTQKLASLHEQYNQLEEEDPNAIFDIDNEEAKFYFYILRNLIRRNDPALYDEIIFLLSIHQSKILHIKK
ncbi:hypothetical protein EP47_12430 [Legionella norrlandica]|uniref:Uncharacterized protein n=1 Tax=Legionella norrlandica TaxID=1498499 RepID=A0A0A2SRS7_9GAMM|nr:hypothetical protein EP47_12430 [Legionella norrlandica]